MFNNVARLLRLRDVEFIEEIKNLRKGIGIDLALPEAGNLHLMLHPHKNEMGDGTRWEVSGIDDSARVGHGLWSLGAGADFVHVEKLGQPGLREGKLEIAPQLIIDADRVLGLSGHAVLTLERKCWKGGSGAKDEPVMQLHLGWHF